MPASPGASRLTSGKAVSGPPYSGDVSRVGFLIICRSRVRAPPAPPAVLVVRRTRPWTGSRTDAGMAVYGAAMAYAPSGHIEQLPSGSWRAKVYAGKDPLSGREIRFRKTRKTESGRSAG